MGFFDTLYWSRKFRRTMELKKSGRMATIPQFTVPEIFVDDEDITEARRGHQSATGSPRFSPIDTHPPENDWRASGSDARDPSVPSDMTLRSRANSIQTTPLGSPVRTTPMSPIRSSAQGSPFGQGESEWQFAQALSRPPSPGDDGGLAEPTSSRSRQNSAVSAADVLEVLDNSAWGESIRRSFTQRRSSGR